MRYITKTANETKEVAARCAKKIAQQKPGRRAVVVGLIVAVVATRHVGRLEREIASRGLEAHVRLLGFVSDRLILAVRHRALAWTRKETLRG